MCATLSQVTIFFSWNLHEKCIIISFIHTHLLHYVQKFCLHAPHKSRSHFYKHCTCQIHYSVSTVHANGRCVNVRGYKLNEFFFSEFLWYVYLGVLPNCVAYDTISHLNFSFRIINVHRIGNNSNCEPNLLRIFDNDVDDSIGNSIQVLKSVSSNSNYSVV